jgi:glycosyltransferase involved in cell wall biosynthesis
MYFQCAVIAPLFWSKLIRDIKPDVIHTHIPIHAIFFSKIFKRTVFTSHSPNWEIKPRFLDIKAVQSVDTCIALSTYMKKCMELYGAKKAFFIPNGVDVNEYRPLKRKKFSKRILFVGRVCPQKGLENLLMALKDIQKSHPSATLTIVGPATAFTGFHFENHSYLDKLKLIVAKHNIHNVEFIGRVDHKTKLWYYQNSDIFVLPSIGEGMSLVMLEAMACGLPVVSTNVSGAKDVIEEGVNGYIVDKKNYKQLASAILAILDNKTRLMKMSIAARKRAKKFRWEHIAKETIKVYERIL